MLRRTVKRLPFVAIALSATMLLCPADGYASGGGGGVDTIKVNKCEYAVVSGAYVELLISASSSNSNALLLAYLPDGTLLGQVQNGGGGRYGGTVFLAWYVPSTITILSSSGGSITVPCTPYQP